MHRWGRSQKRLSLVIAAGMALCLAACWFGYLPKAHPALLEKFNVKIDPARFFHGGVLLVAIGYRPLMAVTGPDGKPQPHGGFYSDRIWFSLRAFLEESKLYGVID